MLKQSSSSIDFLVTLNNHAKCHFFLLNQIASTKMNVAQHPMHSKLGNEINFNSQHLI